jgi:transcriptional regulator with XRE-family HTH domain
VEAEQWRRGPGALLKRGRLHTGLSKRAIAAVAGFDEATWRQLEEGERTIQGVKVPANPRDETLAAAAMAARVSVPELFRLAGRSYPDDPDGDVELSASGADLEELRQLDPAGYRDLMAEARQRLNEARARREER